MDVSALEHLHVFVHLYYLFVLNFAWWSSRPFCLLILIWVILTEAIGGQEDGNLLCVRLLTKFSELFLYEMVYAAGTS